MKNEITKQEKLKLILSSESEQPLYWNYIQVGEFTLLLLLKN